MNKPVAQVVDTILPTRRSKIAFLIDINLVVAVNRRHQHICPDIKFTPIYEQWVVNILLHNTSSPSTHGRIFYYLFDLVKVARDLDTSAPISVLTWLDDPNVPGWLRRCVELGLFSFARGVFDDFGTLLGRDLVIFFVLLELLLRCVLDPLLALGLGIFDFLLHPVVVVLEALELGVVHAVFDVESHGQVVPNRLVSRLIVALHV
jgi:hypothetical protein